MQNIKQHLSWQTRWYFEDKETPNNLSGCFRGGTTFLLPNQHSQCTAGETVCFPWLTHGAKYWKYTRKIHCTYNPQKLMLTLALVETTVVNSDSVTVFKSRWKTFLFSWAFSLPLSQQHTAWPQRLWSYDLMVLYNSHTHPFNGPFSRTTCVWRYQKGKTNLDFTEARNSEWQWHQLGHMQVCTLLQADNHTSTTPLSFYRPDALPALQPTMSKNWRHCTNTFIIIITTSRLQNKSI